MENKFQDSLKSLASNKDFQVIVAELMTRCNYFGQNFNGNSRDIYLAGRRSVVAELFEELRAVDKTALINIVKGVIEDE